MPGTGMWAPNRYSDDHEQREQDLVAQVRDPEHVPQARQQPELLLDGDRPDLSEVSGW